MAEFIKALAFSLLPGTNMENVFSLGKSRTRQLQRCCSSRAVISGRNVSYYYPKPIVVWKEPWVIGVLSHSKNRNRRKIIRQTWAKGLQVLFLVASPTDALYDEFDQFSDMLILDMPEEYFKKQYSVLPYKTQVLFHVVIAHAKSADFILKTDDDSFVLFEPLVSMLKNVTPTPDYWGRCVRSHLVNRDNISEWYVSEETYSEKYWPPYCIGAGYVLSKSFVECAVRRLPNFQHLPIEDIATGVLAQQCNVSFRSMKDRICDGNWWQKQRPDCIVHPQPKRMRASSSYFLIRHHIKKEKNMLELWDGWSKSQRHNIGIAGKSHV